MQVKIITSYHTSSLETAINQWLTNYCVSEVIDIKYIADKYGMHSAMIMYK